METIAVYWESTIRTYGFNLFQGLRMCRVGMPSSNMARWGAALQSLADHEPAFRLVWAQSEPPETVTFFLLFDDDHWSRVQPFLRRQLQIGTIGTLPGTETVDLVFFQGPHYGDRYGVLDFTLAPLTENGIPLLAIACSVATIYLVLPAGWGGKAKTILSSSFEIPRNRAD
jgi:hypothetical protein